MEKITLENWKDILPVGTVFKSAFSGDEYIITDKTEAFIEYGSIKARGLDFASGSPANNMAPYLTYKEVQSTIVGKTEHIHHYPIIY